MNESVERNAESAPAEEPHELAALLQRKCGCGGDCESCSKRPRRANPLSRARSDDTAVEKVPSIVHSALRSSGQPLERHTRSFMESRFHRDFASVRVHDDPAAAASAAAIHARAYTVGNHVVFGTSAFAPATPQGRALLAHELTHVVQQNNGMPRGDGLAVGAPDSAAEREADRNEHSVGQHGRITGISSQPAVIARRSGGGSSAAPRPTYVELVRFSCDTNLIEFVTDQGSYVYPLTECDVSPDLDYIATVTVVDNFVAFSKPPEAGVRMRGRYRIRQGEPNPATFFTEGGQREVRLIAGDVAPQMPSPGGGTGTAPGTGAAGWSGPVVCSRPLAVRGLGHFKHSFVHDDPYNYAIREPLFWGNGFTTSCAPKTDASGPPDDPATSPCKRCNPAPGQAVADVSRCLRAAYSAYAHPNIYRNHWDRRDHWRWGPNSNTFGATLAQCCHDFDPSGLGNMPGWNHSPAGPCNASGPDAATEKKTGTPEGGGPDAGVVPSDAAVPLPAGVPDQAPGTSCSPVAPSGTPTVTNPGANNSFTPSPSNIDWDVIEADSANWGPCVTRHQAVAAISINPWPSKPSEMTVPNTPNPVDGGNIENSAGSNNHWQYAIDDMANYDDAAGGGAGIHWHSTAASEAHEWAHWNEDWLSDALGSAAGGNWPVVNRDLNALREPRASSATPADARRALQQRVDARLQVFLSAVATRLRAIAATDTPGGGGRGYAAGMRVLNGLISSVSAYARSKGW